MAKKKQAKTMKQYKADERDRLRKAGYVRFEAWVHRDDIATVRSVVDECKKRRESALSDLVGATFRAKGERRKQERKHAAKNTEK